MIVYVDNRLFHVYCTCTGDSSAYQRISYDGLRRKYALEGKISHLKSMFSTSSRHLFASASSFLIAFDVPIYASSSSCSLLVTSFTYDI
jgi:hypothetical protein